MIFVSMRVKINNSRRLFFSWSLTSRAYITYPTKYLQNDGIPWVYSPESVRVPKQSPLGLSIRPFEILSHWRRGPRYTNIESINWDRMGQPSAISMKISHLFFCETMTHDPISSQFTKLKNPE